MNYAEILKNYSEATSDRRPPIKLGTKNKAKLEKIRRMAAQLSRGR